ncbi:2,3-diaminopropionate biosynthesis protein SbnB [Shewanella psychrophila]|uniref:2,3-diaminopropionate biosynthesis protein SbnB n=1 Tax=Shewanella psychrophila TaxID=225848 RepID=UPI001C54E683|nr:2,3-diaminopropionate biosynthesis protein SbnB [Shewanella psychrophila]
MNKDQWKNFILTNSTKECIVNMPPFSVIGSTVIEKWLSENSNTIIDLVAESYQLFAKEQTVCPDSYFLRYPSQPQNRIIALPASIESGSPVSGIKWIASFPENLNNGLDRASAVLVLNDRQTGYPMACLEGSQISASRTAASAVLGAKYLHKTPGKIERLAIVGSGLIAQTTVNLFKRLDWDISELIVIDLNPKRAEQFCAQFPDIQSQISNDIESIKQADMVLFTTSAITPHVEKMDLLAHNPTILHMSLRDISAEIILKSQNVADNVDHAVKANTSLHLAEIHSGDRQFMAGDIVQLMNGEFTADFSVPRIYAPFGMGILDIMIGYQILKDSDANQVTKLNDFFPTPLSSKAVS